MAKGTFGENLRREREMRGVSLEEITAATRIATRFLQAIENEQWDQLPGGVFNRGFVKAVAHYLGLDEESIVAEYALAVNDRPSVPVWTGSPPVVAPDRHWPALIFAVILIVAVATGGWFGVTRIIAWRAAKVEARRAAASALASSAATQEAPPISPPTVAASDPIPSADVPPAAPPAPVEAEPEALVTPPDTTPLELKVEAVKKTKVTIEADDKRVFDGTVKAGENRTFAAKDQFDVSAHDAGALLLELNGKTLAPIGPPGHAGKVTLTREALKGPAGGED